MLLQDDTERRLVCVGAQPREVSGWVQARVRLHPQFGIEGWPVHFRRQRDLCWIRCVVWPRGSRRRAVGLLGHRVRTVCAFFQVHRVPRVCMCIVTVELCFRTSSRILYNSH